jgi:hypothetical protein
MSRQEQRLQNLRYAGRVAADAALKTALTLTFLTTAVYGTTWMAGKLDDDGQKTLNDYIAGAVKFLTPALLAHFAVGARVLGALSNKITGDGPTTMFPGANKGPRGEELKPLIQRDEEEAIGRTSPGLTLTGGDES